VIARKFLNFFLLPVASWITFFQVKEKITSLLQVPVMTSSIMTSRDLCNFRL